MEERLRFVARLLEGQGKILGSGEVFGNCDFVATVSWRTSELHGDAANKHLSISKTSENGMDWRATRSNSFPPHAADLIGQGIDKV